MDGLDFHRATLAWKCDGLSDVELRRRSMPPSSLSLLGLVRHMAEVERHWFRRVIAGETIRHVWSEDSDFQAAYDAQGSNRNDAFQAWDSEIGPARSSSKSTRWTRPFGSRPGAAMRPCEPCCFTSSTTTHATTAMPTFFAKVSTGPSAPDQRRSGGQHRLHRPQLQPGLFQFGIRQAVGDDAAPREQSGPIAV